jgi:isopentenyl-diphosphate delta-isomerase
VEKIKRSSVKVADRCKLEPELELPRNQTPIDKVQYLAKMHYLAPSNQLWGEHEGKIVSSWFRYWGLTYRLPLVDYILFIYADVTVNSNPNEIRDHRYVSKQEMFETLGQEGADGSLDARSLVG